MSDSNYDIIEFANDCSAKENQIFVKFRTDYKAKTAELTKLRAEFAEKVFEYYGVSHFSQAAKDKIFALAWDKGHSCGYYEVVSEMEDLIDLSKILLG